MVQVTQIFNTDASFSLNYYLFERIQTLFQRQTSEKVKQNPGFGKRNKLIWVTSYVKKLQTLQLQGKPKHNVTARKFGMEENEVVLLLLFCNVEE